MFIRNLFQQYGEFSGIFAGDCKSGGENMRYGKIGGRETASLVRYLLAYILIVIISGCADSRQASWHWDEQNSREYRMTPMHSPHTKTALGDTPHFLDDVHYLDIKITSPLKNAKIVINKTRKKLYLISDNKVVRIYPVSFGFDPVNDKIKQGDGRTPEGKFYVCTKNPKSKFYLSLGLSYPDLEDADRGLKQGLITKKEYGKIVWAIKNGKRPPWSTKLGGAICIHGGGVAWNWTRGCIALRNSDMKELFSIVPRGTEVIIEKLGTRTAELQKTNNFQN